MQKFLSRYLRGAEIDASRCARCQQACGEHQRDFSLTTTGRTHPSRMGGRLQGLASTAASTTLAVETL
jgi:hypothetical protein